MSQKSLQLKPTVIMKLFVPVQGHRMFLRDARRVSIPDPVTTIGALITNACEERK